MKHAKLAISLAFLSITHSVFACPGCSAALGQKGNGNWGTAFGFSILLMLGMVLTLFGLFTFAVYRIVRTEENRGKTVQKASALRLPLKFVLPILAVVYTAFIGYNMAYGTSARMAENAAVHELSDDAVASTLEFHKGPTLVEFGASWCLVCRRVAPLVERVSLTHAAHLTCFKIDVDQCPKTRTKMKVEEFPCIILYQDSKEVARHTGATTFDELNAWVLGNLK